MPGCPGTDTGCRPSQLPADAPRAMTGFPAAFRFTCTHRLPGLRASMEKVELLSGTFRANCSQSPTESDVAVSWVSVRLIPYLPVLADLSAIIWVLPVLDRHHWGVPPVVAAPSGERDVSKNFPLPSVNRPSACSFRLRASFDDTTPS